MRFFCVLAAVLANIIAVSCTSPTAGVEALVKRRLPQHADSFIFTLNGTETATGSQTPQLDAYTLSSDSNGKIHIQGNSASALASGLHWYLDSVVHVDVYWFIGSQLSNAPLQLPQVSGTHHGSSTVPWRYYFNTVTFSYTAAFWDWEQWELQLDWMALRGINIALAWNGYEHVLVDVLREAGFAEADLIQFLSGPAFQSWNRFGNIQASWGGELPLSWVDEQFALNKQIVARMVELGITPVLPAFTGFVPPQIAQVYANASFVNGSAWEKFPTQYTNVTFLEPFDPLFSTLQKSFISKQTEAYGGVTHIYTLDQYNENNPASGNLTYLSDIASGTIKSLKAADPDAVWMLQGWLFFSSESFWTNERVEAYLGGVEHSDMLILDLFSESQPQWQRTNSYYGKPWIWCQLHDYGANMGMYGQVENVTVNLVEALNNSTSTMVGVGLTMEGQAGSEIMYDLALAQAWSATPIDTDTYFHDWVTTRYSAGSSGLPGGVYSAWDAMRQTVYNNTNISLAQAVTKSIFVLSPNTTGLLNRTGHHPTTITYDPAVLTVAWRDFYSASSASPQLWANEAYRFDLTDITRQVLANAFYPLYIEFVKTSNKTSTADYALQTAAQVGQQMVDLLNDLDAVLAASHEAHFSLAAWISSARSWASTTPQPSPSPSPSSSSSSSVAPSPTPSSGDQGSPWGQGPPWGQWPPFNGPPNQGPPSQGPPGQWPHGQWPPSGGWPEQGSPSQGPPGWPGFHWRRSAGDLADYFEYEARNQVTLWGPTGQISDYASKQWAGLISTYYVPRWQMFVDYTLNSTTSVHGVNQALSNSLLSFSEAWQYEHVAELQTWQPSSPFDGLELQTTIDKVVAKWPQVFNTH